jgi:hypothetical protein
MFKKTEAYTEREIKIESLYSLNDELRRRIEKIESKIDFKKKNESKLLKIKKRSRELLEVSTSHGIPNLVRTRSLFILIMWSSFTIISACVGSYYVLNSITNFFKYEIVTKLEIINEKVVQFPAISICALPSLNTTLDEIIAKSYFDDVLQSNFSNYFEEYADPLKGKCFRYNTGTNMQNKSYDIQNSTIKGIKNGLRLFLNIQTPANYDYVEVALFIHNQSLPPIDYFSRVFWLIPGSFNHFELDRVYHKKLNAPYSNCLNDVNSFQLNKTLIDILHRQNRAYTQDDCFYKCSHLFALQESNCGCNSSLNDYSWNCITNLYNKQIVDIEKGKCVSEYLKEFRKRFQDEKCPKYCPLECDSMSYVINSYTEQIALNGNISLNSKIKIDSDDFSTYEELKKNYFAIRVYYNELKYTLISEEPKTEIFNFISDIGGILGLFLGISFLSFIEIFEIIFEIMLILFNK